MPAEIKSRQLGQDEMGLTGQKRLINRTQVRRPLNMGMELRPLSDPLTLQSPFARIQSTHQKAVTFQLAFSSASDNERGTLDEELQTLHKSKPGVVNSVLLLRAARLARLKQPCSRR